MGERKNPFRNIQFVVRPSTPMLKIIVILVILFSMAALLALSWVRSSIQARTADMQAQAAELEEAVSGNDSARIRSVCAAMEQTLAARNALCKLNKR